MTNKIVLPKVRLIRSTADPREVLALAGRLTYTNKPIDSLEANLTEKEIATTINAILDRKHLSVLRHVTFTFLVSGIGRACSHQMVRHTVGHAYEQKSQHYRLEPDFPVVLPNGLDDWEENLYMEGVGHAQAIYDELIKRGVPRDEARQILPNGIETYMIWTVNLEAIVNFIKARACRVNTKEIMQVAILVRNIVTKLIPEMGKHLGPPCWVNGICYEGKKKYFEVCQERPWKSPIVLMEKDFPMKIHLVGVKKDYGIIDSHKRTNKVYDFEVNDYGESAWLKKST